MGSYQGLTAHLEGWYGKRSQERKKSLTTCDSLLKISKKSIKFLSHLVYQFLRL